MKALGADCPKVAEVFIHETEDFTRRLTYTL